MQGEVESLFGERDGSGLRVNEYFVVVGKSAVGGDSIHLLVGHRVPRRHSCVRKGGGKRRNEEEEEKEEEEKE